MKDCPGTPGTVTGLALRISQFPFACGAIVYMVSFSGFYLLTAFCVFSSPTYEWNEVSIMPNCPPQTLLLQKTLNARKRGDAAFRTKDFATAITCYTQFIDDGSMVCPTVFARRCLSYLMNNKPQEDLGDAMQAQVVSPEWPTAFYLQVVE